tara:strand:+ start:1199 stop:1996 length:798 start_codon:yes stop_codon:yes gene_type:complete
MKVGVIGIGVVGNANKVGFEQLGHEVMVHDIKLGTNINNVLDTEAVFVCVPTPSAKDGSCDTTIVKSVIMDLNHLGYQGIVAIRSSTVPGFCQSMIDEYTKLKICFVPEFIRERHSVDDFTKDHSILVIGTEDNTTFNVIKKCHGHYPKHVQQLKPTEAEICKYYMNIYAALRITYANIVYEVAKKFDCDYTAIKDAYVKTGRHADMYLDVDPALRGYGGACLPKDTKAWIRLLKDLNLDYELFETVQEDNKKFKTTIFPGMRPE